LVTRFCSGINPDLSRVVVYVVAGNAVFGVGWERLIAKSELDDTRVGPRILGAGNWRGKIWIADDFDETPEEIVHQFMGVASSDATVHTEQSDTPEGVTNE
jgi:hypothetical protein